MATGPTTAILAGTDDKAGDVWSMEGTVNPKEPSISFDFSVKSNGAVGVLKAVPSQSGIMFPDGSVWSRFDATCSAAAVLAGSYTDIHHPDAWRTIAAVSSFDTIVAGCDEQGEAPWATTGSMSSLPPRLPSSRPLSPPSRPYTTHLEDASGILHF
eukprot:788059-Pyramimonas_sp.AAC.1